MFEVRVGFFLVFLALLSFLGLANGEATIGTYVGVGALWCISGAALWKASAPTRRGYDASLLDARDRGDDAFVAAARGQQRGRIWAFLWALTCGVAAAAALAIALIANGYPG